jgi:hypothetical protein
MWACGGNCGVNIWDYFSIHMSNKLENGHWISWTWWVWRLLLTNVGDDSHFNSMWLIELLQMHLKVLRQHGCVLWESWIGQYVLAKIKSCFWGSCEIFKQINNWFGYTFWRTPKLFDGLNCESKGEDNGRRTSWGALPGSQHFEGRRAC